MNNVSYVKYIYENKILIYCDVKEQEGSLHALKAKKKIFSKNQWILKYQNKNELAEKLQILNDNGFMFLGGGFGWSPIDIFISMRDASLVRGNVVEISWVNEKQTVSRVL